jgi:hypothetical protein
MADSQTAGDILSLSIKYGKYPIPLTFGVAVGLRTSRPTTNGECSYVFTVPDMLELDLGCLET